MLRESGYVGVHEPHRIGASGRPKMPRAGPEDDEDESYDEDGEEVEEEDEYEEGESEDESVMLNPSEDDETLDDNGEEEEEEVEEFPRRAPPPPARYWNIAPEVKGRHALAKLGAVCFLCGGADHRASDCPDEVCMVCLQRGHRVRDCKAGLRIGVCNLCGRVGHQRNDCPERSQPPPDVSQCRCVVCGKMGHLDCSPYEKRPKRVSCMNCGAGNHTAIDCDADGADRWHRLFAVALGGGGGGGKGGGGG